MKLLHRKLAERNPPREENSAPLTGIKIMAVPDADEDSNANVVEILKDEDDFDFSKPYCLLRVR